MGAAGYLFQPGDGNISLEAEGFAGRAARESRCADPCPTPFTASDNINIYGAMGVAEVSFGDEDGLGRYVFGGGGLLVADQGDNSVSNFGYEGGLGLSFPIGSIRAWIEGRYVGSSDVALFGILGGIAVGRLRRFRANQGPLRSRPFCLHRVLEVL